MPSIRTVGNFFRFSCRKQDKNELLVSAFSLVNLDITQASTITHTHALLHFAVSTTALCTSNSPCTRVRFMILQVLLCVRSTNRYSNAFQAKVMDFFLSSLLSFIHSHHSGNTVSNVVLKVTLRKNLHFGHLPFISLTCKINPIAIMHKTINCIRSYMPNYYISSSENYLILILIIIL